MQLEFARRNREFPSCDADEIDRLVAHYMNKTRFKGRPASYDDHDALSKNRASNATDGPSGPARCDSMDCCLSSTRWDAESNGCVATFDGLVSACRASRGQKWAWTCSDVATAAAVKQIVGGPCESSSSSSRVRELEEEVTRLREEIRWMSDRH